MKLKSGCIFWPQIYNGIEPAYGKLQEDIRCDVAIVGGGISGALMAYHLACDGIDAVVVDRRAIANGSTPASTGLLQYEIDVSLIDLAEKIGNTRAVAAYRESLSSLMAFEPLVAELGDTCGLVQRQSLYLASEQSDVEDLRRECEARRAMGIDVQFVNKEMLRDIFNISRPAALCSGHAFEIDPYRLAVKLIQRSVEMGLRVFAETEVKRYVAGRNDVVLHCAGGATITARKVVYATGYETICKLPDGLTKLNSTYALATQSLRSFDAWPGRFLLWEAARPYLYARTTEDGRAIIGGEDEGIVDPHARDRLIEYKADILCKRFSDLFPDIAIEATCAWAGTFAQTPDGLPYIGSLPQFPHSYFALGYGGNGITFSLLAARIIGELIRGIENDRSRFFGFDRVASD